MKNQNHDQDDPRKIIAESVLQTFQEESNRLVWRNYLYNAPKSLALQASFLSLVAASV